MFQSLFYWIKFADLINLIHMSSIVRMFQSLFYWIKFADVNDEFTCERSDMFQSLFYWIKFADTVVPNQQLAYSRFQSLFYWIKFADFGFRSAGPDSEKVSILVLLDKVR